MKTMDIDDDNIGTWDSLTDLALYNKVELKFRKSVRLRSNPQTPITSAIGNITKPKSRTRIIDRGPCSSEHKPVVGSWDFREKNANWMNPTDEVDVIPHSNIESITFHDNFGNPVLRLNNKYHEGL